MKRWIVLSISLVSGLVAAVLTRMYISAKEDEMARRREALLNQYGTMRVCAFKKAAPVGTVLTLSEIGGLTVPRAGLGGQAVEADDIGLVLNRKLAMSRKEGEVLFWSDVEGGDTRGKGLSADVARQMRAMSINVGGAASVSGMVRPNDHVDVIGTFNFPDKDGKSKSGDFVTCTILQNVLVLATGRDTAKTRARTAGLATQSGYSTVTLEVTPREAEMLAFAEQMKGRLVLTLRNGNDTSTERELPNVDFAKIRSEIEILNQKREAEKLGRR